LAIFRYFLQNEPNFCSRFTALMWAFQCSQRAASSSSTRTVADPVYAFGSRQSRSGKNQRRFLRNEPKFSAVSEAALEPPWSFAGVEFIDENGGGPGVRLPKPDKPRR